MSRRLEEVIERVRGLPEERQDALAAIMLEELEAEAAWDERFAKSPDVLAAMVEQARREIAAGDVSDGDPSDKV